MNRTTTFLVVGTALALLVTSCFPPPKCVLWNRTSSAPLGLYWRHKGEVSYGALVSVSPNSEASRWAQQHGFVGEDWPLLKTVAGLKGDQICRRGDHIYINQKRRAAALPYSERGIELPRWQGCMTLADDEVFLLNGHPKSLDGRYFGATRLQDVDGVAVLIFQF